jgi:preprotein translocase subunit SecG
MGTFLSILIIIACVLLVLIVIIQNPKGGGIASNFISTNQFIGARQQVELIEQITWGFAIGIVVLCIGFAAFAGGGNQQEQKKSSVSEMEVPPVPGNNAPVMPAFPQSSDTAK